MLSASGPDPRPKFTLDEDQLQMQSRRPNSASLASVSSANNTTANNNITSNIPKCSSSSGLQNGSAKTGSTNHLTPSILSGQNLLTVSVCEGPFRPSDRTKRRSSAIDLRIPPDLSTGSVTPSSPRKTTVCQFLYYFFLIIGCEVSGTVCCSQS